MFFGSYDGWKLQAPAHPNNDQFDHFARGLEKTIEQAVNAATLDVSEDERIPWTVEFDLATVIADERPASNSCPTVSIALPGITISEVPTAEALHGLALTLRMLAVRLSEQAARTEIESKLA